MSLFYDARLARFTDKIKMKNYQLTIIALIALLAFGCSGSNTAVEPQTISPTETLKRFIEASKKKDVEAIKKTLSKNSLILTERSAAAQNTTVDELFKRDNPGIPSDVPEMRNEKIEGELASVEVKDQTGGYDTIPFVKEENVWKLAFDKYQQVTIEKRRQEMKSSESNAATPGNKQEDAPANKAKANK